MQELGETFEEVAIRELKEETGLDVLEEDLVLIKVVSGSTRKNSYPNGDQVYNNTVLFVVRKYEGILNCDYEEITDTNTEFLVQKESRQLKFFDIEHLPSNIMDYDLILIYQKYLNEGKL